MSTRSQRFQSFRNKPVWEEIPRDSESGYVRMEKVSLFMDLQDFSVGYHALQTLIIENKSRKTDIAKNKIGNFQILFL